MHKMRQKAIRDFYCRTLAFIANVNCFAAAIMRTSSKEKFSRWHDGVKPKTLDIPLDCYNRSKSKNKS